MRYSDQWVQEGRRLESPLIGQERAGSRMRDPFGNPIRFAQPPDGPIVVPSAGEPRAKT
jgi:hypothetical protein